MEEHIRVEYFNCTSFLFKLRQNKFEMKELPPNDDSVITPSLKSAQDWMFKALGNLLMIVASLRNLFKKGNPGVSLMSLTMPISRSEIGWAI